MTNVLHLRSSFDPGGTETLLLNLFNQPQEAFVMHLALLKNGSLIGHLDPNSRNSFYPLFRKRFLDLGLLRNLNKLVQEKGITIVHSHQLIELVYAVILKLLNPRLKLVHQVHLLFERRDAAFYLERWLSQRFSRIITVSHSARGALEKKFGYRAERIEVLYNAVDLSGKDETFASNQQKDPLTELDTRRSNVVMVSNFVWGKDHETIFQAYDLFIRDQMPEVSLFFIGRESEISERLKKKYLKPGDLENGRMVFTGPIPNAKRYLHHFDIVLQSSFSETFNLALVEAAALGNPVLASDIQVFRELSGEGKRFSLFRTGDPEDLYDKLRELLAAPEHARALEYAPYFRQKFGYPDFIESLNCIYENLARAPIMQQASTP